MVPNCILGHVTNLNTLIKEGHMEIIYILFYPYRKFERRSLSIEIILKRRSLFILYRVGGGIKRHLKDYLIK